MRSFKCVSGFHLSVIFTSIRCVDQSPAYPSLLFFNFDTRGPFHSDKELWDFVGLSLYHHPEKLLKNLRMGLPKCEPYVLTHCDLGESDWGYRARLMETPRYFGRICLILDSIRNWTRKARTGRLKEAVLNRQIIWQRQFIMATRILCSLGLPAILSSITHCLSQW